MTGPYIDSLSKLGPIWCAIYVKRVKQKWSLTDTTQRLHRELHELSWARPGLAWDRQLAALPVLGSA